MFDPSIADALLKLHRPHSSQDGSTTEQAIQGTEQSQMLEHNEDNRARHHSSRQGRMWQNAVQNDCMDGKPDYSYRH